ncbi:NUDIX hydrolase [Hyphomicrobium methylovorum]|uniref:NUDIX hydrolase n=1 Tax=Hyphomicrobium methylovorum TaxID=84 RepID=UPI0015E65C4E|nr:NUDIX hydrolase [Hyphomicrobium methylovorum]MBA2127362.1 NUDIX hydrolase [Hyphomicrobium methylovorum]
MGDGAWDYAARNKAEIESHWDEVRQSNPNYFDGRIFLIDGFEFANGELTASLLATNFRNYIFWRMQGFPEAGVLDGFGSALIRSLDGDIMLGRQRAGNVNAGLAYAPAGFIDAQDVDADGYIDIAASAAREAVEETGVAPESLVRGEGFYLTRSGVQLSLGVPFQVAMTTAEFLRQADAHIAASENSELEAVVALRRLSDADGVAMPAYMRLLIEALFADGRSNPPL